MREQSLLGLEASFGREVASGSRGCVVAGAVAQVQVAGVRVSSCRHLSNVAMREVLGLWCALLVQE